MGKRTRNALFAGKKFTHKFWPSFVRMIADDHCAEAVPRPPPWSFRVPICHHRANVCSQAPSRDDFFVGVDPGPPGTGGLMWVTLHERGLALGGTAKQALPRWAPVLGRGRAPPPKNPRPSRDSRLSEACLAVPPRPRSCSTRGQIGCRVAAMWSTETPDRPGYRDAGPTTETPDRGRATDRPRPTIDRALLPGSRTRAPPRVSPCAPLLPRRAPAFRCATR
jgi:hypothetical protein